MDLRSSADDVRDHARALADLGLSVDEVVAKISEWVMALRTQPDEEFIVVSPEQHEVEAAIRRVLLPLIENDDAR
jgi:hypothetical protein